MSPEQLKKFKESLLEEKAKIENELSEFAQKNPKAEGDFEVRFPQYGQTKDENAQEVAEFEKLKALEFNLEKRLSEINQTLRKMGEDNYGICQSCSNKIEGPRLKAMLTAALCSSCAKKV